MAPIFITERAACLYGLQWNVTALAVVVERGGLALGVLFLAEEGAYECGAAVHVGAALCFWGGDQGMVGCAFAFGFLAGAS